MCVGDAVGVWVVVAVAAAVALGRSVGVAVEVAVGSAVAFTVAVVAGSVVGVAVGLWAEDQRHATGGIERLGDGGLAVGLRRRVAWRARDSGFPVNASGQLIDGTKVDGPISLRNALVNNGDGTVSLIEVSGTEYRFDLRGRLSFYQGKEIQAEFRRLDATGWLNRGS